MTEVICRDNKIVYNAYHLVKAFLPDADIKSELDESLKSRIRVAGEGIDLEAEDIKELYQGMNRITGKSLPWGILTGVRPTKLATRWLEENIDKYESETEAEDAFTDWFYADRYVSREKAETAFKVARKERRLMPPEMKGGYSLYIGIPFCPSVCSYCSFSSGAIGDYKDRVDDYIDALCSELTRTAEKIPEMLGRKDRAEEKTPEISEKKYEAAEKIPKMSGKNVEAAGQISDPQESGSSRETWNTEEKDACGQGIHIIYPTTIYMGGGTPTSVSAEQLDRLLSFMAGLFDIKTGLEKGYIKEFTVEAGRPDSITREKLEVLKKHGVTRISINPQTMQQKTLDIIGRKHTVEQIIDTFMLARQMGFDNINMDMIVGLTGESNDDVRDTLKKISLLAPDSLTVHSLALKRSSAMGIAKRTGKAAEDTKKSPAADIAQIVNDAGKAADTADLQIPDISQMIKDAMEAAAGMNMEPYYLYRQKSIAGNFENIGYAKPGKEGLYNVLIMEEVQSIIACGAGASTKIVTEEEVPNTKRKGQATHLIRSENVKNIDEYIARYGNKAL